MNLHPDPVSESYANHVRIDIDQVTDIEISGVDPKDYPDFCDAFFESAVWVATGFELNENELEALTEQYPEKLNDMAFQACVEE